MLPCWMLPRQADGWTMSHIRAVQGKRLQSLRICADVMCDCALCLSFPMWIIVTQPKNLPLCMGSGIGLSKDRAAKSACGCCRLCMGVPGEGMWQDPKRDMQGGCKEAVWGYTHVAVAPRGGDAQQQFPSWARLDFPVHPMQPTLY